MPSQCKLSCSMAVPGLSILALLLITLATPGHCKIQQPFIEAKNFIKFSYLNMLLAVMTVVMFAVMCLIVLINIFVEDLGPKLWVAWCGGGTGSGSGPSRGRSNDTRRSRTATIGSSGIGPKATSSARKASSAKGSTPSKAAQSVKR